jgi:hypothetical protein
MDLAFPLLAAWTDVPADVTLMVPEMAMLFPRQKFIELPGFKSDLDRKRSPFIRFWQPAFRAVNGKISPKKGVKKILGVASGTETI